MSRCLGTTAWGSQCQRNATVATEGGNPTPINRCRTHQYQTNDHTAPGSGEHEESRPGLQDERAEPSVRDALSSNSHRERTANENVVPAGRHTLERSRPERRHTIQTEREAPESRRERERTRAILDEGTFRKVHWSPRVDNQARSMREKREDWEHDETAASPLGGRDAARRLVDPLLSVSTLGKRRRTERLPDTPGAVRENVLMGDQTGGPTQGTSSHLIRSGGVPRSRPGPGAAPSGFSDRNNHLRAAQTLLKTQIRSDQTSHDAVQDLRAAQTLPKTQVRSKQTSHDAAQDSRGDALQKSRGDAPKHTYTPLFTDRLHRPSTQQGNAQGPSTQPKPDIKGKGKATMASSSTSDNRWAAATKTPTRARNSYNASRQLIDADAYDAAQHGFGTGSDTFSDMDKVIESIENDHGRQPLTNIAQSSAGLSYQEMKAIKDGVDDAFIKEWPVGRTSSAPPHVPSFPLPAATGERPRLPGFKTPEPVNPKDRREQPLPAFPRQLPRQRGFVSNWLMKLRGSAIRAIAPQHTVFSDSEDDEDDEVEDDDGGRKRARME